MARLSWVVMLVLFPAAAQTVQVQYRTLPKSEIERRLRAFEDSNSKREQTLYRSFEEAGCTAEHLTEQAVKHITAPNVICTLPGELDSEIVVGAHFDFVNRGKGVVDNWSGCSLLPSLFSNVQAVPRRHTFVFVGFTAEERGLVGSQFYVHQLDKPEISRISAMVNLDSLGTSTTKLELDRGDKKLANALHAVAVRNNLPLSVVNVHRVGRSDSDSFQDRHMPSINIHSLTNETFPILHTYRDQVDKILMDDYYDTYRLVDVYLAYLDLILDAPSGANDGQRSK
jgi:Zn-dependent M28 family amino/carboxypeptidase